jgi:SAM-dependent methyltransferase
MASSSSRCSALRAAMVLGRGSRSAGELCSGSKRSRLRTHSRPRRAEASGLLSSAAVNGHGHGLARRPALLRFSLCALPIVFGCAKATGSSTASPGGHEPAATATSGASADAAAGARDHHHGHAGHEAHHGAAATPNAAHDGHAHHRHHRFEDAEAWAEQFDDPSRDEWQRPEAVLDFIGLAPDALVADLGAGTGYFAMRLARRVPRGRVLANDIEPDMVRYLGERAAKEGLENVVPVRGSPEDPALPEAVDVAFMCNVYHHLEDPEGYFRRLAAQLRPGGRVIVVDFEKDAPSDVPGPPPELRVARDVLVADLARAGFELVRADGDVLPHQYIVELRLAGTTKTPPKKKAKAKTPSR